MENEHTDTRHLYTIIYTYDEKTVFRLLSGPNAKEKIITRRVIFPFFFWPAEIFQHERKSLTFLLRLPYNTRPVSIARNIQQNIMLVFYLSLFFPFIFPFSFYIFSRANNIFDKFYLKKASIR